MRPLRPNADANLPDPFVALGAAAAVTSRIKRQVMREKVLAMKLLWTREEAEFHGSFVDVAPIHTGLKPLQRPYLPIRVVSNGPRGRARAVEYGDEWFPVVSQQLDLAPHSRSSVSPVKPPVGAPLK